MKIHLQWISYTHATLWVDFPSSYLLVATIIFDLHLLMVHSEINVWGDEAFGIELLLHRHLIRTEIISLKVVCQPLQIILKYLQCTWDFWNNPSHASTVQHLKYSISGSKWKFCIYPKWVDFEVVQCIIFMLVFHVYVERGWYFNASCLCSRAHSVIGFLLIKQKQSLILNFVLTALS